MEQSKDSAGQQQFACAEEVWDGPYRMTCSYMIVGGKCVRHGAGGKTYEVQTDSPEANAAAGRG